MGNAKRKEDSLKVIANKHMLAIQMNAEKDRIAKAKAHLIIVDTKSEVVIIPTDALSEFDRAKNYWGSLEENGKKTVEEISNVGFVLSVGKASVNKSPNVFKKWKEFNFPGMESRYASYAQQVYQNYDNILDLFTKLGVENRNFSSPEAVMVAFRKAEKQDKLDNMTKEEQDKLEKDERDKKEKDERDKKEKEAELKVLAEENPKLNDLRNNDPESETKDFTNNMIIERIHKYCNLAELRFTDPGMDNDERLRLLTVLRHTEKVLIGKTPDTK